MVAVKKTPKTVLKFELRNWEAGFEITVELPYTKRAWDWATSHPNTANVRKTRESKKPVVTYVRTGK